ncbi:tyrosine-type recombinase/integrase [Sphingomonas cavernae]|uniref:tyrosine-type recombinase/integrase n=1 Tax=Sphingomonas cavernae TaxID=2320861 RepID=UPI0015FF81CA|nr:site-specific integrase [Sphingomonas cavernae]
MREVLGTFWTEHAQHLSSASDIFFHFEMLSQFLGPSLPISDVTNAKLLDYRAARRGGTIEATEELVRDRPKAWRHRMITKTGFIRPVAPQTVNRDFAHIQAAMNWARDVHGKPMPTIAWTRLKSKEAPFRVRFAAATEFEQLMSGAHPAMRTIILCAVTTGLRRANILGMQWHQVDLSSCTITLPRVKGDKPHSVSIAPVLRAALARTPPNLRKGPVFDATNYKRRWQGAVKSADLRDFRFHDLRHTFASWARQNGADLADICEALDHSSVAVTQRYAHIQPETTTTAFDRVADLLASQSRSQSRKKRA